jgi:hypothetical protein
VGNTIAEAWYFTGSFYFELSQIKKKYFCSFVHITKGSGYGLF